MYKLVLDDIGDAFFPNPFEITEKYETEKEARDRITEIQTTHLQYTYTPIYLIHPDGRKEDLWEEYEPEENKKEEHTMKEIILNTCYGGYGWSHKAVVEFCTRKGWSLSFTKHGKPITLYEYVSDEWSDLTANGMPFSGYYIDRKDPVAIEILKEFGSDFCSDSSSKLEIEEYDETDFIADIDEYDGAESLHLIPRITESRIRALDIDGIVELLRRTNVLIEEDDE